MTERATTAKEPIHPTVPALIGVLFLEAALLAVGTILVAVGGVQQGITQLTVALLVTAALITFGVAFLAFGLLRGRRRMLGGVLTWQVLQLGCSALGFQGLLGPQWLGWVLLVPAVAGVILCMSRPVVDTYGSKPKAS